MHSSIRLSGASKNAFWLGERLDQMVGIYQLWQLSIYIIFCRFFVE